MATQCAGVLVKTDATRFCVIRREGLQEMLEGRLAVDDHHAITREAHEYIRSESTVLIAVSSLHLVVHARPESGILKGSYQ
jgi:hypothetical protein